MLRYKPQTIGNSKNLNSQDCCQHDCWGAIQRITALFQNYQHLDSSHSFQCLTGFPLIMFETGFGMDGDTVLFFTSEFKRSNLTV